MAKPLYALTRVNVPDVGVVHPPQALPFDGDIAEQLVAEGSATYDKAAAKTEAERIKGFYSHDDHSVGINHDAIPVIEEDLSNAGT